LELITSMYGIHHVFIAPHLTKSPHLISQLLHCLLHSWSRSVIHCEALSFNIFFIQGILIHRVAPVAQTLSGFLIQSVSHVIFSSLYKTPVVFSYNFFANFILLIVLNATIWVCLGVNFLAVAFMVTSSPLGQLQSGCFWLWLSCQTVHSVRTDLKD
jgi:hypothetical protein